jgi:hypothetical protein
MNNTHKHYETARRAHAWTSHNPERRALSDCAYFDEIMAEFAGNEQVQAKFERLFLLSLASKSRCASAMITGPANFPVERQRKASEREHKISGEMLAYIERVRAAIKKEAYYAAHPEARPIMAGDSDAVERLREKLEAAKKYHAQLKEVKTLIKGGMSNEDASSKAGLSAPVRWHSFNIQYANKAVKDLEVKIASLETAKAKPSKEINVGGVRVLQNQEAMRLQLFFNGKPEAAMIATLKSHGFKWSPSSMGWQRQLTNNAIHSFNNHILPAIKQREAAQKGEEVYV